MNWFYLTLNWNVMSIFANKKKNFVWEGIVNFDFKVYWFLKFTISDIFRFISERLKQDATVLLDNDGDDIPIIPELDDVTEDDLDTQVAAPPR